jgi:lysyl-tRNA synthetase class I
MKMIFKLEDGETYQTVAEECRESKCPLDRAYERFYLNCRWNCPIEKPDCDMVTADDWKEVIESEVVG